MDMAHQTELLSDNEKVAYVKDAVVQAGLDVRRRWPFLSHQDAIGALILIGALLGTLSAGILYFWGLISAWVCIPSIAILTSFIHEIEHDLIHWQYFRKRKAINHSMMLLGWLVRPTMINPWIRRELHFLHHKHSGTMHDIEERAITIGEPWGLKRLLMLADTPLTVFIHVCRQSNWKTRLHMSARILAAYFPLGWLSWASWYSFLAFHFANSLSHFIGHPIRWSPSTIAYIIHLDIFVTILIAPNVMRAFCLNFISSNMHYCWDAGAEAENVIQETQVLNAWWILPFQLFCFNFGATHGIHHFVVKEPFYIRQITAHTAHTVMRQVGVRFNDIGTFLRANRYN